MVVIGGRMVRLMASAMLFTLIVLAMVFDDGAEQLHRRYRRSIVADGADQQADVLITVKTTVKYYATRVRDIVDTWFQLAPDNIFFFTDDDGAGATIALNASTGGHLVRTKCDRSHSRQALCCKMNAELDYFIATATDLSWMCHFDDDNYVNVEQLIALLDKFNPRLDWYLGRPSTRGPIDIVDPRQDSSTAKVQFWFATGGAGFCLSRSLVRKMTPFVQNGRFEELCDMIRLPDDVTIGYLIEHLLDKRLTVVDRFHSHLESLRLLRVDELARQISFSADGPHRNLVTVPNADGALIDGEDRQHFRSLHCFLFPTASLCKK